MPGRASAHDGPSRESPAGSSICRDGPGRTNTRQTTHIEDFPRHVTILRPRHPLQGQTLEIFDRVRLKGVLHLIVVLPDHSRLQVPADWTDLDGHAAPADPRGSSPAVLACVVDLLHARTIVDALLNRLDSSRSVEQPDSEEGKRATTNGTMAHEATSPLRRPELDPPESSTPARRDHNAGQADHQMRAGKGQSQNPGGLQ